MPDPVTEFELYRQELLDALGEDDPVGVLRATLAELDQLLASAPDAALNHSPAPGEWAPRDVLSHLADSDLVTGMRVRMIVTQDHPTLIGYDQEAWTSRFGGLDPSAADTIARWRTLRQANLRIYESLTPEEQVATAVYFDEQVLNTTAVIRHALHDAEHHLLDVRRGIARQQLRA